MNDLPFPDPRNGVLVKQPLAIDKATALLFSNAASERFGSHVNTTPTSALPVSFELQTTTRVDPNAQNLDPGVQGALTVGPLPEAYGINYGG